MHIDSRWTLQGVVSENLWGGEIPQTKADFAPDVAFEILSPSDAPSLLQRKRQDYHESGVIQVWIDLEKRLVELVEPDRRLQYFQALQVLVIGTLPGFRVELERLFAG